MSYNVDDINVGGQLKVGTGVCAATGEGDTRINGSAMMEGPVVIGNPSAYTSPEATLMVGALVNDDPDCEEPKAMLGISGSS